MRPTKTLAGLVLGALALFGVGTNVQAGWVLALAALLGGIAVVGAILPFRALRGVHVTREAPRRVRAGDSVPVSLEVAAVSSGPRGPLLIEDRFLGSARVAVGLLRPGRPRRYDGDRDGARRGVHGGGPVTLWTGSPFGVVLVGRTVEVPTHTIVEPRVRDVALSAMLGRSVQPSRSAEGDVATVREYRPGDPLRLVHWRSTARRGELVVREFEDRGRGRLTVAAALPDDPDGGDAVASLACSFALAGLREGYDVTLSPAPARPGEVRSADVVGDWGARLVPGSAATDAVPTQPPPEALVCVLHPQASEVHRAAQLARSGTDVLALVVTGNDDAGAARLAASVLAAAGARVCVIRPDEDPLTCSLTLAAS